MVFLGEKFFLLFSFLIKVQGLRSLVLFTVKEAAQNQWCYYYKTTERDILIRFLLLSLDVCRRKGRGHS